MSITATPNRLHWNYFLALDQDLAAVARYVEFSKGNFAVYSIELAHILFAAASEVDAVAKVLCKLVSPTGKRENMNHYRAVLSAEFPDIATLQVFVPRYGSELAPWNNWLAGVNPDWWKSYNNVKHQRDKYFAEASLKNALNALGGLLLLLTHYYSRTMAKNPGTPLRWKDTTYELLPEPSLIRLHQSHYYESIQG